MSLTKGPSGVPTLFFFFLGIFGGGLAIVFCSWNFMIDPIWNNFSHRERNLKSSCHPPPLNFFFYCWTPFWERPMSPRTNGKRENSIYYTWKTFFMATRQKGRSNTDFFLSLKIFLFTHEPFLKRPVSPRTNGKRGNSISYTWKTFFKTTRSKGRLNIDFFFIPENIFFY